MGTVRPIGSAPSVHLSRIGRIHTFEVMENELDTLDRIVSEESQSLAFASGTTTTFIALLATVLTMSGVSPMRAAVMASLLAVSGLASLVFTLQWLRVRRERPKLLARIRERGVHVEVPG